MIPSLEHQSCGRAISAGSLAGLEKVAHRQHDYASAQKFFEQSLAILPRIKDKIRIAETREEMAKLACTLQQAERAARLFGAAEALREGMGCPIPLAKRAEYDRYRTAACDALGKEVFAQVCAEGRAMSLEDAIEYALGKPDESGCERA
jgi:hypothetical protein